MSSVPGFPLIVTFEREKQKEYKIHWQTSAGNFVSWDVSTGKVDNKGNNVETDKDTIYWNSISQELTTNLDEEIKIEVLDEDNHVLGTAKITLNIDSHGYVRIKE